MSEEKTSASQARTPAEVRPSNAQRLYSASTLFYDEQENALLTEGLQATARTSSEITAVLWVGIDVGSTTAKIAVLEPGEKKLLFWKYRRHFSRQAETVAALLAEAHDAFPLAQFKPCICGSGAEPLAAIIGGSFVQEVIANSIVGFGTVPLCKDLHRAGRPGRQDPVLPRR